MTIANGDFGQQASGSGPGVAASWTASETSTSERYAQFLRDPGALDATGQERFDDGWLPPLAQDFVADFSAGFFVAVQPAFFNAGTATDEAFEDGWGEVEFVASGLGPALFGSALDTAESMESEWGTTPLSFDQVTSANAGFGSGNLGYDGFESEWLGNELYLFSLTSSALAQFTVAVSSAAFAETFEGTLFDLEGVTAAPATDVLSLTSHGLVDGWIVRLRNVDGVLPGGLQAGTDYVVISATANTFQLSGVLAGPAVDVLDVGAGTHFIVHDDSSWWTEQLAGI